MKKLRERLIIYYVLAKGKKKELTGNMTIIEILLLLLLLVLKLIELVVLVLISNSRC